MRKPRTTNLKLRPWVAVVVLFVGFVALYNSNGSFVWEGDATANVELPLSLLLRRKMSFTPEDSPELFKWATDAPLPKSEDFYVRSWNASYLDGSLAEWRRSGALRFVGPQYVLAPTARRDTYVDTFGPIPGLTILPLFAGLHAIDPLLQDKPHLLFSAAKLHASVLTAGCVCLLFWTALEFASYWVALLIAVTFGAATCAWAISSQTLWQQTAAMFFLLAGIAPFIRKPDGTAAATLSGLGLGLALACRPTSIVLVLGVALYRFLYHRRTVLPFLLGLAPAPLAMAFYNYWFFGNPMTFAQTVVGHAMATEKTQHPELWQTPFLTGAAGLLVSPSRGLLLFSPVLAFGFHGALRAFKSDRWRPLRPLILGALWMMAVQCKWFDWWGGWAYGYRPWLDATPILALSIACSFDSVARHRTWRGVFAVTLAWSIVVQFVGAFAYDKLWNARTIYVVRPPEATSPTGFLTEKEARAFAARNGGGYLGTSQCNIDRYYCRYRLWSVEDSMLTYYFTHFREARKNRQPVRWDELGSPATEYD